MRRDVVCIVLSLVVALALLGAGPLGGLTETAKANPDLALGFDTATDDNSATALGTIDSCQGNLSISDTFTIDLYVQDVTDLCQAAFIVEFDPSVVHLISFSDAPNWFLGQSGSMPYGLSHPDPTTDAPYAYSGWPADWGEDAVPEGQDGSYWIVYGELQRGACESGSGILARFEGVAVGNGTSTFSLIEQTRMAQQTTVMLDSEIPPNRIGDIDGDGTYDGAIVNGVIAVGQPCPAAPPVTGSGSLATAGRSASAWPIALLLAGGVTAVVAAAAWAAVRGQSR